ncbi:bicoid-interacting protein BIN3, putative [Plasmodium malariae]|uniref:RNA methyltransferase n=1 Tax=Plasmodium malariae TaxID=5858 RepID=A0A1A8VZD9_PLAMA|nr:bicoid-interacting protein BIN3, putative [Plasmodium malariae]SBS85975.1 bicoid-interacting protein BIN3, putative [Plasmodium malariae]SCN12971.1 bicoid-interacting protein BIN3, putative [Plasmodium malariae]
MTCIFKNSENREIAKLKDLFEIKSIDAIYGDEIINKNCKNCRNRKNGKNKRICLHGNYPNYFYERYKKRTVCNKVIINRGDAKSWKEEEEYKNNERICYIIEQTNKKEKENIDDYRLTYVNNLIKDIFNGKDILDIGCNCGVTTFLLSLKYKCKRVNGIDIDYSIINKNVGLLKLFIEFVLIYNSQKHMIPFFLNHKNLFQIQKDIFLDLYFLYEHMKQVGELRNYKNELKDWGAVTVQTNEKVERKYEVIRTGVVKNAGKLCEKNEGKLSDKNLGFVNETSNTEDRANQYYFPFNIYFLCSNIFDEKFDKIECMYDIIICFSVLKWIQLNYGDDCLVLFFKLVHKMLKSGGYFILEYHKEIKYKIKSNEKKYYKHETKLNYDNFDDLVQGTCHNTHKMVLIEKTHFRENERKGDIQRKKKGSGMFNRTICIYRKV